MNTSLSLRLLTALTAFAMFAPAANAQATRTERQQERFERRMENQQRRADTRATQTQRAATNQAIRDQNRAANQVNRVERRDDRRDYRPPVVNVPRPTPPRVTVPTRDNRNWSTYRHDDRRWDNDRNNWNDRRDAYRYRQAYNNLRDRWADQRQYVRANLRKVNQIGRLNQLQQQQLDAQLRAAYLAYHNNHWNGTYNFDNYSEPQFLDYLYDSQPSLLDRILGYLGVGNNNNYLYSPDWSVERSQLGQNMQRIHQLALEGRITRSEEQQLLAQMRSEFMNYHNNRWNGGSLGWSQYSDPGFLDYLNNNGSSLLTTVRSYLGL